MSSRATATAAGTSKSSTSTSQRRQRSRSTSRYADLEKPKKKKTLSATTSLVSIPNTIKLSMLNSGLLSFEKVKLEARDQNNSLSQTIPDKPIELRHFVKLCEQRRKFPVLYKLEFQTAVKVETNSCRHASRKNNEEKNQNQRCIPYDYNRVVLEKQGRTVDSDYINASYVDSLLKPNAYIVTQGPTEETVNDFWRMIWQENVSAIIMLTKVFDFTKVMCMQYWPPALDKQEVYGDIHIGIDKEEQLANFHIRTFRIWKANLDNVVTEERSIIQFHYTEWHSHTCPFPNAVLEFRRRVRAVVGNVIDANSVVGPMLVHCNDGGGRSGVYMAIDANLELAEEEDCFHVFGYLKKIRQSRKGLIENVEQYKFVYDTLEEHIVCGKTWFSVSELSERLKAKARKDPVSKMNQYQLEYAQICKQTPRFTIGDCAGGHRGDNRDKNRDVLCVPPDNFRPYLTSFQGNAFTDYINAVFVDGYTKPREYIVTEWPLKHTVGEFWSLVYDQECSAVVVLLQPPPNSTSYPSFWPEKSKMEKYGPVFSVHSVSRKHYTNIKQWEYKINKKIVSLTELMAGVKAPTKTVQLFQLTCFPLGHKVPTSTNSLVALMNMVENWRAKTDYGPVCVVSPDGRSRAGVYCAANACIEQVIQHGEVDIFQAVKTVRRQRPQLVENMMEYKYCYDLVLHYVLHYLNKDLKEKKFIEFGRGKVIPLTPDSSSEQPNEKSNTGKIVVKKRIPKLDSTTSLLFQQQMQIQQQLQFGIGGVLEGAAAIANANQLQRKKKGRLYSLGGNEPAKRPRGRLDRLKTVGTFDLGTEMSVLTQVARNLGEKIVVGGEGAMMETPLHDLTEGSTPSSGRKSVCSPMKPKRAPPTRINGNKSRSSTPTSDSTRTGNGGVRTQHSADDCLEQKTDKVDGNKRSLSTSSYIALSRQAMTTVDIELEPIGSALIGPPSNNNTDSSRDNQMTTQFDHDISKNDDILFIEQVTPDQDSNKSEMVLKRSREPERSDNDSNKIELDMRSVEDIHKCDDDGSPDDFVVKNPLIQRSSQKPTLRKSKRIVRSDSEIMDDCHIERTEIVLQANYDIQIHNEPNYENSNTSPVPPIDPQPRNRSSTATSSTTFGSRKESSDIDDIVCSPKDPMYKSTDDSSRNVSTDDIDTVFSDTNELEQLQRDYRQLVRCSNNLQREYKSDGDSLDEVGKKRNEYITWKNQSFENDFELYKQTIPGGTNSVKSRESASEICSPDSRVTSTTNSSDTGSNNRPMEEPSRFPFKIKPILKANSSRESAANSNSPQTSPTLGATKPDPVARPTQLDIDSQESSTKTPAKPSLFEKRFGKIKKINNLLKCKRFSTSALYEGSKKSSVQQLSQESTDKSVSPADVKTKEPYMISACKNLRSKFSPGKSNIAESKASIYSSKLSLFNYKSAKFFSLGKSSMFSTASHSNAELNVGPPPSTRTKLTEFSKSNTELHQYKSSPARYNSKRSIKSIHQKNNSAACLYKQPLHSPLSEEFYNPTGSVRLSAMELYEKFCSEDFGGLYKHEVTMNMERRGGTSHEYRNLHAYRLGQRGLGVSQKYNRINNSRLLRQKSEPKFSFRGNATYFAEEDDEEDIYEEGQDEYSEHDDYEDEYEDEYDEEEEEEDEEGDYYEDEEEVEEEEGVPESGGKSKSLELEPTPTKIEEFRSHGELHEIQTGTLESSLDVDEIFLMPARSKCTDDYDEYGFENKQFSLEQSMMARSSSTETGLDHIAVGFDRSCRKLSLSQEVRVIDNFGSDEILTIYKICSKDSMLSLKDCSVIYKKPPLEEMQCIDLDEVSAGPSSLEIAIKEYEQNAPPDIEIIDMKDSSSLYTTECLSLNPAVVRSESIDLLSISSGTFRSGSTLTEYAFDTVRNLQMDSCCSASRLSLSIKSEIFDEYTMTPDPDPTKIVRSCDFEDFTLTPDESINETIDPQLLSGNQQPDEQSFTSHDAVLIVDKFLAREHQLMMDETAPPIDEFEQLLTIVDLDEDTSQPDDVSDFTTEITKEFDLLFSRAEHNYELQSTTPPPSTPSTLAQSTEPSNIPFRLSSPSKTSPPTSSASLNRDENDLSPPHSRIPSRYSMQRLEPFHISDLTPSTSNGFKLPTSCSVPHNHILYAGAPVSGSSLINNPEYCPVLDLRDGSDSSRGGTMVHRRIINKLRTNRSQSLGSELWV